MKQEIFRTHTCGELTGKEVGKQVVLSGWVLSSRNHGGVIFIDLKDRYGITQITFDPNRNKIAWETANTVGKEYVIRVTGTVSMRPANMINSSLATGEIEIDCHGVSIISKAETTPFEIEDEVRANEELRLKYRYLDLRSSRMQKNIAFRSRVVKFIRDWMFKHDFLEIETPILTVSSPEGARDFLVPSRLHPGKFYALPQAPQQYKQLLMVAGFDRYFQIAPCMRDEDARADRSPGEFYQLDVETSFMTQDEFFDLVEPLFVDIVRKLTSKKLLYKKFPKIAYKDAMNRFGSDKPDLRFGFEFCDVTDIAHKSDFKIFKSAECVKAICVKQGAEKIGRNEIDTTLIPLAKKFGAGGLAWMRMTDGGFESSIVKFFDESTLKQLAKILKASSGDLVFFVADKHSIVCKALGAIRSYCGSKMEVIDENILAFAWIVDFPMYEYNESERKVDFCHNPFSMPQGGLEALKTGNPLDVLAYQYDIICNGYELSSGAVRNFDKEIMYEAFKIAGYDRSVVDNKFGHMIKAFSYGAPPHCGFAPGIERLVMILAGESTIREVTAFPKNGKGEDLMVGAPGHVDESQLAELGIKLRK